MTYMENQTCVLCKKEIKGRCYIITKPDKDSYYMSSEENLIGKFICDDDAYEEEGQQVFSDVDGSILASTKGNNGVDFYFKEKIVANNFQGNVSTEELKEVCDIVKNFGAEEINGLEKAITINSDVNSDEVANSLHNLLNKWKKKSYIAILTNPEISKLEIYVNKEDKEDFIKIAKRTNVKF